MCVMHVMWVQNGICLMQVLHVICVMHYIRIMHDMRVMRDF